MKNQPLFSAATVTAVVSAVLSLLVAFGLDLTEAQSTAILGVTGIVAPFVVAWVAHGKVTPNAKLPAPPAE